MKRYYTLALLLFVLYLVACSKDDDEPALMSSITLKFTQNWNGTPISKQNLNKELKLNNKKIIIENLRYLISDVRFINKANDTIFIKGYNAVDVANEKNLNYKLSKNIKEGDYQLLFRFGLSGKENKDNSHKDLDIKKFNAPKNQGGGYYHMQLNGHFFKENNTKKAFYYYTSNAFKTKDSTTTNTSFLVDLGSIRLRNKSVEVEIKMNVLEWFKPNKFELNKLKPQLTGNYNTQILMKANGKSVFKLGEITY